MSWAAREDSARREGSRCADWAAHGLPGATRRCTRYRPALKVGTLYALLAPYIDGRGLARFILNGPRVLLSLSQASVWLALGGADCSAGDIGGHIFVLGDPVRGPVTP